MYPQAYIDYLVHFHGDRDYFECHEVLEEYWKREHNGIRDHIFVGLIQIAVSLYHHRRGNKRGAERMMEKALINIRKNREYVSKLGMDDNKLIELLTRQLETIRLGHLYSSFSLPISDPKLLTRCIECCKRKGFIWEKDSDLENTYLLNKHTLRDRTEVIEEREKQLIKKRR